MSGAALDIPASHDDLDGVPPPAATPTLFGHRSEFAELASAEAAGRRLVRMVDEDLQPSRILTQQSFENALYLC